MVEFLKSLATTAFLSGLFGGLVVTFFWAILLYIFRPSLCIARPTVIDNCVRIQIKNLSWFVRPTNLKLEVAIINNTDTTQHLEVDLRSFIFIPTNRGCNDNIRVFKAKINNINELPSPFNIRVRVHALNEFTGFGRAYEKHFVVTI